MYVVRLHARAMPVRLIDIGDSIENTVPSMASSMRLGSSIFFSIILCSKLRACFSMDLRCRSLARWDACIASYTLSDFFEAGL